MESEPADQARFDPGGSFDPLFEAHYGDIYKYCVRRLGRSDAEDATADVFAVAWRRIQEMPEGEMARAWLYGVAFRVVGNQYRGRQRRSRLSARLAEAPHEPLHPEEPEGEFVELISALGQLSTTDQELLRLSAWDGLTRQEIARVLGIKANTVDQRLHRARNRLKSRLDRLGNEASSLTHKETPA